MPTPVTSPAEQALRQAQSWLNIRRSAEEHPMSDVAIKTQNIFRELAGSRAQELTIAIPQAQNRIAQALSLDFQAQVAADIAFHLTDWQSDAAFIVALTLYPERFSDEEIKDGIERFVIHAPNHMAAAAKLKGYPVEDIFGVGALDRK